MYVLFHCVLSVLSAQHFVNLVIKSAKIKEILHKNIIIIIINQKQVYSKAFFAAKIHWIIQYNRRVDATQRQN